jgi:CheY-like chemotaxis protein
MARIVTINDYPLYAQMVADLISRERGHEVKMLLSPIVVDEITSFGPDVVVVSLVRKLESMGHGRLYDFFLEVDGAKSFREIARAPETKDIPIILSSMGVREVEIPQDLAYMALAHFPHEIDHLLLAIDKLVLAKQSGRRAFES